MRPAAVLAVTLLTTAAARAQGPAPGAASPMNETSATAAHAPPSQSVQPVDVTEMVGEPKPAFEDPTFGPRYLIEEIEVAGNHRTRTALVLEQVGLRAGDVVSASDPRVEAARYRLLSLGYFFDVRLSLVKGQKRGGARLRVEIEERGTIVVNAVYLGTSDATPIWGGLDVAQQNAFGRGIWLGGGIVGSAKPDVAGADNGLAFRLRAAGPTFAGTGVGLSGTALYSAGSEFFRARGPDSSPDPTGFVAVNTRRRGGILGASFDLARTTRLYADGRYESIDATFPPTRSRTTSDGALAPIDFQIREGRSRLSTAAATLDIDTRSDPVLPHAGGRMVLSIEVASPIYGSSYGWAKGMIQASVYKRVVRDHSIGVHVLGGALFGEAPYFDRFFVGDLNLLLPPRALGLNFSTQPSRDLLGTAIAGRRYQDFAGRVLLEYAIPLWRRHGFVYGGDFFAAIGVLGLASLDDLRVRDRPLRQAVPLDVTADLGLRLDTYIGIFTASFANVFNRLGRIDL